MKPLCYLLCSCLVFSAACRKKREATPAAPEALLAPQASQPVAPGSAPAAATTPGTPAAAAVPVSINNQHFNQLSEALLKFNRDKKRGPKNWEELISTGYLKQMPTPPPGKAYVFDRSLNVLMVNQ